MTRPRALINTFYSTIAIYLEYFFGLLISIMIARQLGPQEFGIYSYLIWLSALSMVVVNGGVTLGGIKFIAEARVKNSSNDILAVFRYLRLVQIKKLFLYASIAFTVIFFFGGRLIENINSKIIYIVIVASMVKTYHMFCISILKGFEDFHALAIVAGVVSPINLLLILFCYFTEQPLEIYIWVYFVVCTMYLLISSYFLFKKVKKKKIPNYSTSSELKSRLSHHLWTASWISILSFVVLRQSELFFLNIYSSSEEMAYFNVGYSLAFASMILVPGVYSAILLPLMARENKEKSSQALDQLKMSLRYMFQLVIALVFPICFFAEEIFEFLYGAQYQDAVLPFRIILVCLSLKTLSDCTNAYLLSTDKQSLILKLIIIASVLTLSLDFYLIKQFQLEGAILSFSVSTVFLAGSYMFFAVKRLKLKLEWKIYTRTVISGIVAILLISPFGYYMSNIYGVILGIGGYILLYILMLLVTLSFSPSDIKIFRKINLIIFRLIDRLLIKIQNKAKITL